MCNCEWRDIETAPKDGTYILVWPATWSGKSASIARWDDDKHANRPRPYWSRDDDLNRVTISRECDPVYWMRLPAPPAEHHTQVSA